MQSIGIVLLIPSRLITYTPAGCRMSIYQAYYSTRRSVWWYSYLLDYFDSLAYVAVCSGVEPIGMFFRVWACVCVCFGRMVQIGLLLYWVCGSVQWCFHLVVWLVVCLAVWLCIYVSTFLVSLCVSVFPIVFVYLATYSPSYLSGFLSCDEMRGLCRCLCRVLALYCTILLISSLWGYDGYGIWWYDICLCSFGCLDVWMCGYVEISIS